MISLNYVLVRKELKNKLFFVRRFKEGICPDFFIDFCGGHAGGQGAQGQQGLTTACLLRSAKFLNNISSYILKDGE